MRLQRYGQVLDTDELQALRAELRMRWHRRPRWLPHSYRSPGRIGLHVWAFGCSLLIADRADGYRWAVLLPTPWHRRPRRLVLGRRYQRGEPGPFGADYLAPVYEGEFTCGHCGEVRVHRYGPVTGLPGAEGIAGEGAREPGRCYHDWGLPDRSTERQVWPTDAAVEAFHAWLAALRRQQATTTTQEAP